MPHALISLYLTALSLLPLFHSSAIIPPRTCCLSAYLYNSILNNSSSTDYVCFVVKIVVSSHSFLQLLRATLCHVLASVLVSLTCSLFRYNVFFFRDRYRCLSRTTFVAILPFSAICSSPSTGLFRTLLRFTCSRPLARSPPLSLRPFPGIYVRYSGCYKLCPFIDEKHRESMFVRMENIGQSAADFENVFTGYVNFPITCFFSTSELVLEIEKWNKCRFSYIYKRKTLCNILAFNVCIYFTRKLYKIINQVHIMRVLTARKSNRIRLWEISVSGEHVG